MKAVEYLAQARNLAEPIGNALTLQTIHAHLAGACAHPAECGAKAHINKAKTLLALQ